MSIRKVVRSLAELPNLADEKKLIVDVETTSFNDVVEAFHPFNGHRIAGVGVMTTSGDGWYVPVRHAPMGEAGNLPIKGVMDWCRDLGRTHREYVAHNLKFDFRFFHVDNVHFNGTLKDTVVLSRLVDVFRYSARLGDLSKEYLPEEHWKDDSEVKQELKARKSKDYGVVPVDIMGKYCIQDMDSTWRLEQILEQRLPAVSKRLWEIEQGVTRTLLESECRGANVPRPLLKQYMLKNARRALQLQEEINVLACEDVDCGSPKELAKLMDRMCIKPVGFTKNGNPSWGGDELEMIGLPLTDKIAEFKRVSYGLSTYGEGWLARMSDDDTLHPAFKQSGAKTGRLACEDPNFQNLDINGKAQVVPRLGYCFLSIDYSQIEFRLFAHYTNSPSIIARYRNDPMTDYHQGTADMLGLSRTASKRLNFGMIYGMGREKLVNELIAVIRKACFDSAQIPTNEDQVKAKKAGLALLKALESFNWGEAVSDRNAHVVANCVYNGYHRMFPEIRALAKNVESTVKFRGDVRNAFGRVYKCPKEFAHKARNYIIQGSAADLFKDRLAGILPILHRWDAYLIANVHDEVLIEVPIEAVNDLARELIPYLESPSVEFRVPIRVEASVCYKTWAQKEKFKVAA